MCRCHYTNQNSFLSRNLLGASESDESVVVHVNTERVVGRDVDVDSQVKLATVNQVRVGQVSLYNNVPFSRDLVQFVYYLYSNTSR